MNLLIFNIKTKCGLPNILNGHLYGNILGMLKESVCFRKFLGTPGRQHTRDNTIESILYHLVCLEVYLPGGTKFWFFFSNKLFVVKKSRKVHTESCKSFHFFLKHKENLIFQLRIRIISNWVQTLTVIWTRLNLGDVEFIIKLFVN